MTKIIDVIAKDIRFPTSQFLDGSDAMNPDPDYSAAYVILKTDHPEGIEGHGLTFTIGRGNELCVATIEALGHLVIGKELSEITNNFGAFWKFFVTIDSQLRWLGPEKGVIHLSTGAIINAIWDLYAKTEGKPLWQLIYDMSPEQIVNCIDFTYITDALKPEEALGMLREKEGTKYKRLEQLKSKGYPAYTTSAGWLGYSEDKIRRLCQIAIKNDWKYIKMKVGANIEDDIIRAGVIREEIGYDRTLMMDANQKWDVDEAIENMKRLAQFRPLWIEEPTSPDDILGHKKIGEEIHPIKVATGEHCQNRVMFKQFLSSGAMDICQIDSCRVGGVNEILAILLLANKYKIPICPHAGGVGLCEYVQHLSMIDFLCISGSMEGRLIEYVDHLHEHFLDPVLIEKGHYQMPGKSGFSITMRPESIAMYEFPNGQYWLKNIYAHSN